MSSPKEIAPGIAVTAQPDAAGIAGLAGQGFRTIINNRPDGEESGQIPASVARSETERLGLVYVHIPVTSGTITAADVAAFDRAVRESPKPIVAHCRSGTRTYLLW
ncbi:MAG TPA: TIGR01244 family sulfur transferase, partial [Alphaproteobacteria bacterium]|nr:TIGR01244 family sulfur transferase [Alphaproteobacteria bacterium]